jgi:hypothetical protein
MPSRTLKSYREDKRRPGSDIFAPSSGRLNVREDALRRIKRNKAALEWQPAGDVACPATLMTVERLNQPCLPDYLGGQRATVIY